MDIIIYSFWKMHETKSELKRKRRSCFNQNISCNFSNIKISIDVIFSYLNFMYKRYCSAALHLICPFSFHHFFASAIDSSACNSFPSQFGIFIATLTSVLTKRRVNFWGCHSTFPRALKQSPPNWMKVSPVLGFLS